jgi:hypothetical protein
MTERPLDLDAVQAFVRIAELKRDGVSLNRFGIPKSVGI